MVEAAPAALRAMSTLESYLEHSGLSQRLLNLVRLRASQLNGCAYCIDMHWKDLRALGESEQRLYGLDAWRESPYYDERERAALSWTEAVTFVADGHVPDDVFDAARAQFSDRELTDLTFAIGAVNMWNRMAIALRTPSGRYKPKAMSA